jgi:ABC-2 type transport system ATP-binding protein
VALAATRRPESATGSPLPIRIAGLTKRYGATLALDALDLAVPAGSVYGFLGPNGAGKTTTLRMLMSLAVPTTGRAWIGDVPVGDGVANRRALTGYLDQDPRFPGWMHGRELLELVGRLYGLGGGELRATVDEALERVGLAADGRRAISGYSGGMRQRLGIAQAILRRPPVLILDEPVSALDPEGRHDLLSLIGSLGGRSTVLFSTHILSDVERVCDNVAILDHGRLVTHGPMAELLDRYAAPVFRLEADLDSAAALDRLGDRLRGEAWVDGVSGHDGALRVAVRDPADGGRRILAAVVESGVGLLAFERQRPTLEDVFLRLVGRGGAALGGDAA